MYYLRKSNLTGITLLNISSYSISEQSMNTYFGLIGQFGERVEQSHSTVCIDYHYILLSYIRLAPDSKDKIQSTQVLNKS